MTVPNVTEGRGAWTTGGKLNGSKYYRFVTGKPMDGSSPARDVNFQAVNLAVKDIQRFCVRIGVRISVDGVFGPATENAVQALQRRLGLADDGVVGPATMKTALRATVRNAASVVGCSAMNLWGLMLQESGADGGAVGYATPSDRGLWQFNLKAHPNLTPDQVFDSRVAAKLAAERLGHAEDRYDGKGQLLRDACSIAQHNAPAWADRWYETGSPPNDRIAKYVESVRAKAQTL